MSSTPSGVATWRWFGVGPHTVISRIRPPLHRPRVAHEQRHRHHREDAIERDGAALVARTRELVDPGSGREREARAATTIGASRVEPRRRRDHVVAAT
jgi:hypothetical protein